METNLPEIVGRKGEKVCRASIRERDDKSEKKLRRQGGSGFFLADSPIYSCYGVTDWWAQLAFGFYLGLQ